MEFCTAVDKFPYVANVLLAIFFPIIHLIYAIIFDVSKNNMVAVVLDILSFAFFGVIFYVLNLVYVIAYKKVFAFSYLVKK